VTIISVNVIILATLVLPLAIVLADLLFWRTDKRKDQNKHRAARWLGYSTTIASLISLILSILLAMHFVNGGEPLSLPLIGVFLDALSVYFILLVNVVACVASWSTFGYLEAHLKSNPKANPFTFHIYFNLFHFTMLWVAMVNNLVLLWIAVELTTLVSTLLVAYRRDRLALEAAWKYIIITSTGIIFALLGTMFLANALPLDTATTAGMNWSELKVESVASQLNKDYVRLSFIFIMVGYGTKAGLAPMFTWLPDGHGQAPSPVSAMLSGVLLKSALYAILRFYTITNMALQSKQFTSSILLYTGLLSLAMAVPFILKRNSFKRILAYHSLEHMGIITFGIGIGGMVKGVSIALFGALLHMLNHALTKALMFLTFGRIRNSIRQFKAAHNLPPMNEGDMRGLLRVLPWTSGILVLGGLALVGSPPFNIFLSEFITLWGALQIITHQPSLAHIAAIVIFLVSVTLIFGGLVRHMARMLLGSPKDLPTPMPENHLHLLPLIMLLIIIIATGVTLFPLSKLIAQSAEIISQCSDCL
jgi:hydrogenase-4 component F